MKKKNSGIGIFLLVVAVLIIAYAMTVTLTEPRLLQYVTLADNIALDTQDEGLSVNRTRLREVREALYNNTDVTDNLNASMSAYTLSGHAPAVSVSVEQEEGTGNSALTGLIATGENYFSVHDPLPLLGRLLNPEELERGLNVALIDEQLAIKLFQMSEVIDREIRVGGVVYRIVGVLRHTKQIGDDADHYVYLPYRSLEKHSTVQLETLMLTARPGAQGGAKQTFEQVTSEWRPGGTLYDIGREKVGAWIWARYLLCALGFTLWGLMVGAFARSVTSHFARLRERLRESYMSKLLPWFVWGILWRIVVLALLAGMAGGLMLILLDPVNYFPEYVPAVLVEPRDIAERFWALRGADAMRVVLKTPEVVRLQYMANIVKTAVIIFLAGLALNFFKRQRAPR